MFLKNEYQLPYCIYVGTRRGTNRLTHIRNTSHGLTFPGKYSVIFIPSVCGVHIEVSVM